MTDPFVQRFDERAREDDVYFRRLHREQVDRVAEQGRVERGPIEPCLACGHFSVEVDPGCWLCACHAGYPA